VKAAHPELIADMEKRGLLYPVTVMDGVPVYDGAVSYPAILRAVQNKLAKTETATAN
jgi:disulfide oxidoreductase YuzD